MQKSRVELMLSPFDEVSRTAIVEFGKRISSLSAKHDLVIIMARKAVALTEALRSLGLVTFDGPVTSSRILDLDLSWLRGKSVAVVDDALISGTTLFRVVEKLRAVVCKPEIHVLCASTSRSTLVEPMTPYLELGDDDTASLCANIVDAISLVPLPYATDYPTLSRINIAEEDFEALLGHGDWDVSDCTCTSQRHFGLLALAFQPTAAKLAEVLSQAGLPPSSGALAKIRLYARKTSSRRGATYHCTAVPFFAFDPLHRDTVDRLYRALVGYNSPEIDQYFDYRKSNDDELAKGRLAARLRLAQYFIALRLGKQWIESLRLCATRELRFHQDAQNAAYLFPPAILQPVLSIVNDPRPVFSNVSVGEHDGEYPELFGTGASRHRYTSVDVWGIESEMTQQFLNLYRKYEQKARELAREYGSRVFEDPELIAKYKKIMGRLDRGYSLSDMRAWTSHIQTSQDLRYQIVSAFLDKYIDRGVVVPTTCVSGEWVYRGYRHGEDVQFGDEEKRLLAHMLESYSQKTNRANLSSREVEKCSVIFIKKGIERHFLNRPVNYIPGQKGTIGIRWALHGAVVEEDNPNLIAGGSGVSIRQVLRDGGFIREERVSRAAEHRGPRYADRRPRGFSVRYKVTFDGQDANGIQKKHASEARLLGKLLGSLRSASRSKTKAHLTENDLILLASAETSKDVANAVAAEVRWAERTFEHYRASYMARTLSAAPRALYSYYKGLRSRESDQVFGAITSGIWKYESFRSERVKGIVQRVSEDLRKEDRDFEREMWGLFFCSTEETRESIPSELNDHLTRMAAWLYYTRACLALLQISFLQAAQTLQPHAVWAKELSDRRNDSSKFLRRSLELGYRPSAIASPFSNINAQSTEACEELRAKTIEYLNTVMREGLTHEELNDTLVSPLGEFRRANTYTVGLAVTFACKPSDRTEVANAIHKSVGTGRTQFRKANTGKKVTIDAMPDGWIELDDTIVYAGAGFFELDALLVCATRLLLDFGDSADIRCFVFHNLPPGSEIHSYLKGGEFRGTVFRQTAEELLRTWQNQPINGELIIVSEGVPLRDVELGRNSIRMLRDGYILLQEASCPVVAVGVETFVSCTTLLPQEKIGVSAMKETGADIGIIAVVSDELRAVQSHLGNFPGFNPDVPGQKWEDDFVTGSLPSSDGKYHSVAVVQSLRQGNQSVTAAYQKLTDEYNPSLIVLIGIGGAVDTSLDACDVCVANQVLNYDSRAETPDGPKRTADLLPPIAPGLLLLYRKLERAYGEDLKLDACDGSPNSKFAVRMGPIGSGGAVVKDEDSEIREWLLTVCRKATAVETEAVGAASQQYEYALKKGIRASGLLIVRGISDKADANKNKEFRMRPVANAMIFLEEFLRNAQKGRFELRSNEENSE